MKRMLIAIAATIISWCVLADTWIDPEAGIEWTYTVSDGKASVGGGSWDSTAVSTSTIGDITIPATLGGCPVTSIGEEAFGWCSGLTSVTIPTNVMSIAGQAFYGCSGLTSVTISEGVTNIGDYAFSCCSGLTSVTIPSSVTSIGSGAFLGCSGLTSVTIPENVTSIGDCAFRDCYNLTGSVTIPEGVASVGIQVFCGCSGLTSVTIPSSVTNIGDSAFWGCSGLTSVTIPSSVTSIGDGAFSSCYNMTTIEVDEDNDHYLSQNGVLFNRQKTELITYPSGRAGAYDIPLSVKSVGGYAFQSCYGLTSVTIPSSVTSIGKGAFSWCAGLPNVTIPSSVTKIGYDAFSGCSGLGDGVVIVDKCVLMVNGTCPTSVVLPEGTRLIADGVFFGCSDLTSVTIPSSVTSIGSGAFWNCSALTSVTIPEGMTSIGDRAFEGCIGLTSVTMPSSVTSIDDCVFEGCSGLTSVTMQEGVVSIGDAAFMWCSGLKSVTISSGVTNIGSMAFYQCNFASVTIPSSVTSIGGSAFWCCSGLRSVDFEGAPPIGVEYAEINQDAVIRYNAAYEDEWLSVIETCGWTNATAHEFMPRGWVSFVAPNGEASVLSQIYTNETYGVLPEARREGFTFAGWYTSLDGTNRVSAFSAVDPNVTALYARWVEDDASLYAQWEANRYSVSFNANGGEGEMATQPFLYDQAQALNGNGFTKLGYTFKGWATAPDGEVVYTNGVSVSNLTAEAGFAVALFAKWEKAIEVETEVIEDWVAYDLAPMFKKDSETKTQYRRRFEEKFGDDYEAAFFKATGKIGMDGTKLCVWHDYVAGTDPLDETSQFKATVTMESGVPVVKWKPALNGEGVKSGERLYKVLGAKTLGGGWAEVEDGHEADYNFFKVTVEMP